jgi:hypothetical protein
MSNETNTLNYVKVVGTDAPLAYKQGKIVEATALNISITRTGIKTFVSTYVTNKTYSTLSPKVRPLGWNWRTEVFTITSSSSVATLSEGYTEKNSFEDGVTYQGGGDYTYTACDIFADTYENPTSTRTHKHGSSARHNVKLNQGNYGYTTSYDNYVPTTTRSTITKATVDSSTYYRHYWHPKYESRQFNKDRQLGTVQRDEHGVVIARGTIPHTDGPAKFPRWHTPIGGYVYSVGSKSERATAKRMYGTEIDRIETNMRGLTTSSDSSHFMDDGQPLGVVPYTYKDTIRTSTTWASVSERDVTLVKSSIDSNSCLKTYTVGGTDSHTVLDYSHEYDTTTIKYSTKKGRYRLPHCAYGTYQAEGDALLYAPNGHWAGDLEFSDAVAPFILAKKIVYKPVGGGWNNIEGYKTSKTRMIQYRHDTTGSSSDMLNYVSFTHKMAETNTIYAQAGGIARTTEDKYLKGVQSTFRVHDSGRSMRMEYGVRSDNFIEVVTPKKEEYAIMNRYTLFPYRVGDYRDKPEGKISAYHRQERSYAKGYNYVKKLPVENSSFTSTASYNFYWGSDHYYESSRISKMTKSYYLPHASYFEEDETRFRRKMLHRSERGAVVSPIVDHVWDHLVMPIDHKSKIVGHKTTDCAYVDVKEDVFPLALRNMTGKAHRRVINCNSNKIHTVRFWKHTYTAKPDRETITLTGYITTQTFPKTVRCALGTWTEMYYDSDRSENATTTRTDYISTAGTKFANAYRLRLYDLNTNWTAMFFNVEARRKAKGSVNKRDNKAYEEKKYLYTHGERSMQLTKWHPNITMTSIFHSFNAHHGVATSIRVTFGDLEVSYYKSWKLVNRNYSFGNKKSSDHPLIRYQEGPAFTFYGAQREVVSAYGGNVSPDAKKITYTINPAYSGEIWFKGNMNFPLIKGWKGNKGMATRVYEANSYSFHPLKKSAFIPPQNLNDETATGTSQPITYVAPMPAIPVVFEEHAYSDRNDDHDIGYAEDPPRGEYNAPKLFTTDRKRKVVINTRHMFTKRLRS